MSTSKKGFILPEGYSLLQTALHSPQFLRNPIQFISGNMEKFNGTYSAALSPKSSLILTQDPAFVNYVLKDNHSNYHKSALSADRAAYFFGKGLLFSNGQGWLKQRRLIQPGFHQKKIQGLYEIMINSIDRFLATFPTGKNIDVYPLMHQLAFTIVINSLFDIPLPRHTMQELDSIFTELQGFLMKETNQPFRKWFYPVTGQETRAYKKSQKIRQIIKEIVHQRTAGEKQHNDLLDMLLNSRYEDNGEPMTEDQLIDEILVLIFAGHETAANTLSWLLYLIHANTTVLEQLKNCVKSTSVYNSFQNVYINAVINESMRLYPAAWMTDRVAVNDDQFAGFSYPKGTIIIPFFFGVHRHKQYWEDADLFRPERFIDENGKSKKNKNFFPFGAGPRMCIGNNFAMAEMSFVLHAIVSRFNIEHTGIVPAMKPLITLRPSQVILNIEKI